MPGQQPPLESSRDAVRGNPDQRVDDDRQHDHIGAQELTCIHRKEADAGLGTDGFGRSDTRAALREFFEVNRYYITVAALKSLSEEGKIDVKVVEQAVVKYGLDANKPNPVTQ